MLDQETIIWLVIMFWLIHSIVFKALLNDKKSKIIFFKIIAFIIIFSMFLFNNIISISTMYLWLQPKKNTFPQMQHKDVPIDWKMLL